MKHTLISNEYFEDTHKYIVTVGTDMGQFTGYVQCLPADYSVESKYFGWELAEIKAEIEYARAKKKHYSSQLKALTEFWRNMSATRTYDQDAFWVKKMREKVDDIELQRHFWDDRIAYLKECYHLKITTFDSFNKTRKRCEEQNND